MMSGYNLKQCLVTGASGFVGRVLCEQLQKNNVIVRALLRHQTPGPWHEVVLCDLLNFHEKAADIFSGIDTIFYLASIAHDKAPPELYEEFNTRLCLQFARSALEHGVKRFVYVSSTKAMADPGGVIVDENFIDWPTDPYGISKRKAEEGLLSLTGFEHLVIIRPCLVYGKGVQGNLLSMSKWIQKGIFPPLPDTGEKRSMISVRDVASALIISATSTLANRKIYLLSDGVDYSVKDIEKIMRHVLLKKVPRWNIPYVLLKVLAVFGDLIKGVFGNFIFTSSSLHKLLGPARYSSRKIQSELKWRPTENFFEVLPEMIEDTFFIKNIS